MDTVWLIIKTSKICTGSSEYFDKEIIGVYSSEQIAKEKINSIIGNKIGINIHKYELDKDLVQYPGM